MEDLLSHLGTATNPPRSILGATPEVLDQIVRCAKERFRGNDPEVTRGGEQWALGRLDTFLPLSASARRESADVSNNNSSRLASCLAMGTLSPRAVYERVQQALLTGDSGCQWLASHLEIRDFFVFLAFASGP